MRETVRSRAYIVAFVAEQCHELPGPDSPTKEEEWSKRLIALMSQYLYAGGDTRLNGHPGRRVNLIFKLAGEFYDAYFSEDPYQHMPGERWFWIRRIARLLHAAGTSGRDLFAVGLMIHDRATLLDNALIYAARYQDKKLVGDWTVADDFDGYKFLLN